MKKISLSLLFILSFILPTVAQFDSISLGAGVKMKIGGFIRNDLLFDSRRTEGASDGLFSFFPMNEDLDANGEDLNAVPTSSLYAISSRLGTFLSGPMAFRARTTGAIEFDFTGNSGAAGVRLRQAWMNLHWGRVDVTAGRTWHPLTIACAPNTIALSTGAPFAAFNRSEQLRTNVRFDRLTLSFTALYRHTKEMQQSLIPELNVQVTYADANVSFGGSFNFQSTLPKTYVEYNGRKYKTTERINTPSVHAFFVYQKKLFVFKTSGIYGQMLNDLLMMGDYAIQSIDPSDGREHYTASKHINVWANALYGKRYQVGLFVGYLKNLGYADNPSSSFSFGRGGNIAGAYRIAPSFNYNLGRVMLACELEYTAAAYGTKDLNDKGKVVNTNTVANTRVNFAGVFFF